MIVIGLSSWRRMRRLIPYETWYFVHLTGYLAVLLGFGHQLTLGADFATDTLAFWWWTALFVGRLRRDRLRAARRPRRDRSAGAST